MLLVANIAGEQEVIMAAIVIALFIFKCFHCTPQVQS